MFFLPRAILFVLWFLFVFLVYFLLLPLSCNYQCRWLSPKWPVICWAWHKTTP